MKKKTFFLKKEKSVDFKPVESSSRTAGLRMQLWPSKKHACKTASSAVLDIQAPIRSDDWRGADKSRRWKKKKKKKKRWSELTNYNALMLTSSNASRMRRKKLMKVDEAHLGFDRARLLVLKVELQLRFAVVARASQLRELVLPDDGRIGAFSESKPWCPVES